jgi:hypothetical protein
MYCANFDVKTNTGASAAGLDTCRTAGNSEAFTWQGQWLQEFGSAKSDHFRIHHLEMGTAFVFKLVLVRNMRALT